MTNFSLFDLCPIVEGGDARQALFNSLDLAQHAEALGYKRYWMAEHHNVNAIASAATSVALGFIAAGTKTIRVGAAGVMLPNHAPLVIAEQYGTLASIYSDRVDLGLGRAPGTDGYTMRALRRDAMSAANSFPQDVVELMAYFDEGNAEGIQAIPGRGLHVPVWILGSSLYGAQLAAALGQPYIFASHFAPGLLDQALQIYREQFQASARHDKPYVAAAVNVVGADSMEEAKFEMTSLTRQVLGVIRGDLGPTKPPSPILDSEATASDLAAASNLLRETAIGTKADLKGWFEKFLKRTQVDELVLTCNLHNHEARRKSFALAAEALLELEEN